MWWFGRACAVIVVGAITVVGLAAATARPLESAVSNGVDGRAGLPRLMLPASFGAEVYTYGPHSDGGDGRLPKNAVDFSGGDGTVRAAGTGTVRIVMCRGVKGLVLIDHDGTDFHTGYYHMNPASITVTDKQHVNAGDVLGQAGTATPCGGVAKAAHVHFTLWRYKGSTATYPSYPRQAVSFEGVTISGWTLHGDRQGRDCDNTVELCGSVTWTGGAFPVDLPFFLRNDDAPIVLEVVSPLVVQAAAGLGAGSPLTFAFTMQNISGADVDVDQFSVHVRGPSHLSIDERCNGGSRLRLATNEQWACLASAPLGYSSVGTYTAYAKWLDHGAVWHIADLGHDFTLSW